MPRAFNDGNSENLILASTTFADLPHTMACWFNTDDDTITQTLMFIGQAGVAGNYIPLKAEGAVGDVVRLRGWGTVTVFVDSTTSWTANTWRHAIGVTAATNDRSAYLDGGGVGTDSTESATTGEDRIAIGASRDSSPRNYMSGSIFWAAIWSVALDATDAARLGTGFEPVFVQRHALGFFSRLMADEDQDLITGGALTPACIIAASAAWAGGNLTLTVAAHPFQVGDSVTVTEMDADVNGTHTVTAITSTTIVYALADPGVIADSDGFVAGARILSSPDNSFPATMVRALPRGRGRDRHRFT
jgi:hypothetical protein